MTQTSNETKTVLLVEDNEDNRFIYATALRYAGYEVIEAVSGKQGIEQAREHLPHLILMDISIPDIDGWEATIVLKADSLTRHTSGSIRNGVANSFGSIPMAAIPTIAADV